MKDDDPAPFESLLWRRSMTGLALLMLALLALCIFAVSAW